jgi:hypothetical protein
MKAGGQARRRIGAARGWIAAVIAVLVIYPATPAFSLPKGGSASTVAVPNGYRATGVAYGASPSDPNEVTSVSFTLAPAGGKGVMVQLGNDGAWFSCTNRGGSVTCPVGVEAAAVDGLTIVAR